MFNPTALEKYLKKVDLRRLLVELGISEIDYMGEIEHFTEKEAEKRDQIVLSYFGEEGVKRIVETVVNYLLSSIFTQT